MELLHRLPEGGHLNKTKFKPNPKNDAQLLLTLGVAHEVDANICGMPKGGGGIIKYLIHVTRDAKKIHEGLTIDESICPIADQSADELKTYLNAIRPKSGHDISAYEQHSFDYRAFSYVLGCVIGKSVAGVELDLTTENTVKAKTLGNIWNNPSAGDFLVCPSVIKNSKEWGTFACLAGCAGARYITYMNDTLPASSNQLVLEELAAFCFRLQAVVLSVADSTGSAGHHELAFFRGLSASLTMHAHSDEGGWIRGVLSRATYPRPRGLLAPLAGIVGGLPTHRSLALVDVTRVAIAYLLRGSALIAAVDGDKELTLPTILKNSGEGKPGDVDELMHCTYANMTKWRRAVVDINAYIPEKVNDLASAKHYFSENKVDSHLSGKNIIPFWFIEPSVILPDIEFALPRPVCPGKEVLLPMLSGAEALYPSQSYGEVNGRPLRSSKVLISLYDWRPRNSGISYILNAQYNPTNGLSLFVPHADPRIPTKSSDMVFAPQGAFSMSEQRWLTPHNPLASPAESFSLGRVTYLYQHPGTREYPNLEDLKSGMVSSRCGDFFLTSPEGFASRRTSHDIPERLQLFFNSKILGEYDIQMSSDFSFIGLPDVIVPTAPSAVRMSAGGGDDQTSGTSPASTLFGAVEPLSDPTLGLADLSGEIGGLLVQVTGGEIGLPSQPTVETTRGRQVAVRGDDEPGIAPRPPQSEAKPPNGSE